MTRSGRGADLDAEHFDGQQTERQYHSHEQDRIADDVQTEIEIRDGIRVIRKLALEITVHGALFIRCTPSRWLWNGGFRFKADADRREP